MNQSPQYFGRHLKGLLGKDSTLYTIMTARGCPHRCTYCSNSYFLDKFKGSGKALRFRSAEHVLRELENVRRNLPTINGIAFYDDDFLSRPLEDLKYLAAEYKKRIAMPFSCMVSPWSFNREKMKILIDAGLVHAQLGVQSGSERINKEVFNRNVSTDKIVEVINGLESLKGEGLRSYLIDLIVENPYETVDDQYSVLMFLRRIPRKVRKQVFTLIFYPKTELTKRAIADGFITEDEVMKGKLMGQRTKTSYGYYEFLVEFHKLTPSALFQVMTVHPVFAIFKNKLFNPCFYYLREFKQLLDRLIVKTVGPLE